MNVSLLAQLFKRMLKFVAVVLLILNQLAMAFDGRVALRAVLKKQEILSQIIEVSLKISKNEKISGFFQYHAGQRYSYTDYELYSANYSFSAHNFFSVLPFSKVDELSTECKEVSPIRLQ